MKIILSDKIARITKNRKKLEEALNVKITNRGKEVFVQGDSEDEYVAEKVIDALNFGFPYATAILIKEEELVFEILNIKEHTRRKDFRSVRARVIGKGGKVLQTLSQLTACYFELKDNFVGIIGLPELIENATEAVIAIVKGAKHSNVYAHLEKSKIGSVIDLGLKEGL